MPVHSPTPYPDVNAVLQALLSQVQTILQARFVGMYLAGSLAMGDFDDSSEIDVLVLTTDAVSDEAFLALAEMHGHLAADYPKWGQETEVSYMPKDAVRRYDPTNDVHPYISRGEQLRMVEHRREWDVQRHIVREWGVVVVGPDPRTLIDPIGPDGARQSLLAALRDWWPQHFNDSVQLHPRGYRSYLVLTGCRMLYTLEYGVIVSKPVAARWAQQTLGSRWAELIEWAIAARLPPYMDKVDNLNEAQKFIQYVIERGRQFKLPTDAA